jgi:hypothetical protein
MKLVKDWKKIARNSWAIRLSLLGAGLTAAETWLPGLSPFTDPKVFLYVSLGVSVSAALARVVAQASLAAQTEEKKDV